MNNKCMRHFNCIIKTEKKLLFTPGSGERMHKLCPRRDSFGACLQEVTDGTVCHSGLIFRSNHKLYVRHRERVNNRRTGAKQF